MCTWDAKLNLVFVFQAEKRFLSVTIWDYVYWCRSSQVSFRLHLVSLCRLICIWSPDIWFRVLSSALSSVLSPMVCVVMVSCQTFQLDCSCCSRNACPHVLFGLILSISPSIHPFKRSITGTRWRIFFTCGTSTYLNYKMNSVIRRVCRLRQTTFIGYFE